MKEKIVDRMSKLDLLDRDIRTALSLRATGSYDDVKNVLLPYLSDGSIFEKSKEEYQEYFGGCPGDPEIEAMVEEAHPNVYEKIVMGMQATLIYDWPQMLPHLDSWDFVRKEEVERMQMGFETLWQQAISNLKQLPVFMKKAEGCDDYEIYEIASVNASFPSYTCSMLLRQQLWDDVYQCLNRRPFYVLPVYREYIYVIPIHGKVMDESDNLAKLQNMLPHRKFAVPFSEKIFFYDNQGIEAV